MFPRLGRLVTRSGASKGARHGFLDSYNVWVTVLVPHKMVL